MPHRQRLVRLRRHLPRLLLDLRVHDKRLSAGQPLPQHGRFPDASCGDGADFWTCTAGPTFWGCCKSNPCKNGGVCPDRDLTGAFVGNPVQSAYYLAGVDAEMTSVSVGAAATLATAVRGSASATATATTTSAVETATAVVAATSQPSSHAGAIAGGAAAGGVLVALLVCWLVYYIRYIRRARANGKETIESGEPRAGVVSVSEHPDKPGSAYGNGMVEHYGRREGVHLSPVAPPEYTSPRAESYALRGDAPDVFAHRNGVGGGESAWKPGHRAQVSELEGETVWRGELESPMNSERGGGDVKRVWGEMDERPARRTTLEARWVEVEQVLGIHTMDEDEVGQRDYDSMRSFS